MSSEDDDPAESSEPPDRGVGCSCGRRGDASTQHTIAGVEIDLPATVIVDASARVEPGARLGAGVQILGDSVVAEGAEVGAYSIIEDSSLGNGVSVGSFCTIRTGSRLEAGSVVRDRSEIANSTVAGGAEVGPNALLEDSVVDPGGKVGPFSRVRARSTIAKDAYVGTHAEVKASVIGEGSKVGHFSFVGDSILGTGVNIGAGAVTANWDGTRVRCTEIEDGTSIGAGTVLVAPVRLAANSKTGAGAVVTSDVGEGETVVGVPARLIARQRLAS